MGSMQVSIPTFLVRLRGLDLKAANIDFSIIVIINGVGATLLGGWLGDRLLKRYYGAYYSFSGIAMLIAVPFMVAAIYVKRLADVSRHVCCRIFCSRWHRPY